MPRCLLWHGWLLGLSIAGERDPSAASLGQLAVRCLEITLLIILSFGLLQNLKMQMIWPWFWRTILVSGLVTGGFEVAGAGVYLPAPDEAFRGAVWGTAEEHGDAKGFHAGTRSSPVCAAC